MVSLVKHSQLALKHINYSIEAPLNIYILIRIVSYLLLTDVTNDNRST